jgi:phosphatidylserine/phosphatidylglycerophosphate/cardiolipin synthase-like enzyme
MKRVTLSLVAIVLFVLVVVARFSPRLSRWLETPARSVAPVATPGAARVEGPYFSDGDRIAERIIAAINHSQKSIHLTMYDLTQPEIVASVEAAHRRGLEIRIVADERQSREPHEESPCA